MSTKCMIFVEVSSEDLGKVVKPDKQLIYAKGLRFQDCDDEKQFPEEDIDKFPEVLLNKRYIGIYDHWDGYPPDIGDTLLECFNTYKDALNLMLFGDESTIVDFLRPHALCSTIYKDEDVVSPTLVDDIPTDLFHSRESDFVYLFKNGIWRYTSAASGLHGGYKWFSLEEDLMMAKMPELISEANPNSYDSAGGMLIRAKKSNLKQFLVNACNFTELNDSSIIPLKNHWYRVDGAKRAFIMPVKTYDLTSTEDNIIALFLYKQAYDIHIDRLVTFSQRYHVDFRLFTGDDGTILCRNVEVVDGKVIKNEFLLPEDDDDWEWPIIWFGDSAMQNRRAYRGECTLSPNISTERSEILKAVADEQGKRFIETCPCCGKAEMFTYSGKTDGWPSSQAGIYICNHCGCKESEGTISPLSKWAVFKKENTHVFLPKEESNGKA